MVNPQHDVLKTAVSELKTALDLALTEAKNALNAAQSAEGGVVSTTEKAATGAEAFADTELDTLVTTLEGMGRQLTTVAHITRPTA